MDIKIVKESVEYGFNFDEDLSEERLEKIEDVIYELEGVCDIEPMSEGFYVIVEGKHDSLELLDRIVRLIKEVKDE